MLPDGDLTTSVLFIDVVEKWCRGTKLNCRHQPFQGINKVSKYSMLCQKTMQKVTFAIMEYQ